jgi:hypothetical protein
MQEQKMISHIHTLSPLLKPKKMKKGGIKRTNMYFIPTHPIKTAITNDKFCSFIPSMSTGGDETQPILSIV